MKDIETLDALLKLRAKYKEMFEQCKVQYNNYIEESKKSQYPDIGRNGRIRDLEGEGRTLDLIINDLNKMIENYGPLASVLYDE